MSLTLIVYYNCLGYNTIIILVGFKDEKAQFSLLPMAVGNAAKHGCDGDTRHGKDKIMNDETKKNVESDEIVEVSARKVECIILLGMLIALILIGCAFIFGLEIGKSYGG